MLKFLVIRTPFRTVLHELVQFFNAFGAVSATNQRCIRRVDDEILATDGRDQIIRVVGINQCSGKMNNQMSLRRDRITPIVFRAYSGKSIPGAHVHPL